jgi:selenocysteine-specific elongation factor
MFVIGTAGHIDHGKSSIIMRLTGIDPDRLPEEKERGMTIDLGFAWYDSPHGKRIGIVDVPGHEKFVRNMIAGAGGIDAVILVVAADDGWMPQSQEHLQITKLLAIKFGIVAITKIDLVENSWVDLVEEDLRDRLRNTFLADAPIVRLSSTTGEGFDKLKDEIGRLSDIIMERDDISKPRLCIDRSFVLPGMGGVVTGTLRGGTLRVGQEVSIFPSRNKGKIRTIHSHNQLVDISLPGQRTAVSMTGIDKEYLIRGGTISTPEIIAAYPEEYALAIDVSVIEESEIVIEDRRRLLMILGTMETEGEIRLLENYPIPPGGRGIMFFRPFSSVLAFVGDRFILRLPTPQKTIGGGVVLDILCKMPRRKDLFQYEYLKTSSDLTPENLINSQLTVSPFVDDKDLLHSNYSDRQIKTAFDKMVSDGLLLIHNKKYYRPNELDTIINRILESVQTYFNAFPHKDGIALDEICRAMGNSSAMLEPIIPMMIERGQLARKKNLYDVPGREIYVTGELKNQAELLSQKIKSGGFAPLALGELIGEEKRQREALEYLILKGEIVRLNPELAFHKENWINIINIIYQMLENGESLTVASLREKLNNSRKYTVPILEETDRIGITERNGDIRTKGKRYDESKTIL